METFLLTLCASRPGKIEAKILEVTATLTVHIQLSACGIIESEVSSTNVKLPLSLHLLGRLDAKLHTPSKYFVCVVRGKEAVSLDISACWYNSSSEQGPDGGVPSGAYIFRPDGPCYNSTPASLSQMDNSILFQAEQV